MKVGAGSFSLLAFSHRSRVAVTSGSAIMLLLATYSVALFNRGPVVAAAIVCLVCALLATFVSLEVGLGLMLLSMLLSPEIPVAQLNVRPLTIRIEDLLIPVLVLAWLGRRTLHLDRSTIRNDPVLIPMFGFVVIQVLSSLLGWKVGGIDPLSASFYIVKQIEFFGLFYFVLQYAHTTTRARYLIMISIATSVITALYNFGNIPGNEIWTANRISAPFEGANPEPSSIGAYFVLVMAFLLSFGLEAEDRSQKWLFFGLTLIIFVPFIYTLSRSSYVAFLVMFVILALWRRSRPMWVLLIAGCFAAPFLLPDSVIDRIVWTFNDPIPTWSGLDRSFEERVGIWRKVRWSLPTAPFLGRGVTWQDVIDSYYARVLIETGIAGLVVFGLLIARLFVVTWRLGKQHPLWWARAFAVGYGAALCGLLVHGFSAITFVIVRIMEPFWAATGLIFGLYHQMSDDGNSKPVAPE